MKLPRDVDARQLTKALAKLGYRVTRQNGSHLRLTLPGPESHSVTVPNHSPSKPGALNAILAAVATRSVAHFLPTNSAEEPKQNACYFSPAWGNPA